MNLAGCKVRLSARSGRRQTFDSEQACQFRLHRCGNRATLGGARRQSSKTNRSMWMLMFIPRQALPAVGAGLFSGCCRFRSMEVGFVDRPIQFAELGAGGLKHERHGDFPDVPSCAAMKAALSATLWMWPPVKLRAREAVVIEAAERRHRQTSGRPRAA